jgi:phage replication O-like protein O
MPGPQLEDGHTRFANELLEALARAGLHGREFRVVLAVARLTYGYQKKADSISYGQIADLTGISRRNVISTVQGLLRRRVLHSVVHDTRRENIFSINKHYKTWIVSPTTPGDSVAHDTTLVSPTTPSDSVAHDTLQRKKKRNKNPPLPPDGGSALSLFPPEEQKKPAAPAKKPSTAAIEKQAQEVLAHLNQVCSTKYRNPGNIIPRIREGNTVQDLVAIIDCKARDEFFREHPKHMNPVTLFRPSHFERYLAEAKGEIKAPAPAPVNGSGVKQTDIQLAARREREAAGKATITPEEIRARARKFTGESQEDTKTDAEIAAERDRQVAELNQRFGTGGTPCTNPTAQG